MRLSIVVPAHNEEQRIGRMLGAYLPFFTERYGRDVEFLVVINGTTDGTENVVAEYASRFPVVKTIVEPGRIGKGGALMLGFRAAAGDRVGFVDADGSTPPEAFQALVDGLGDADAIIASRWCRGARVSPRQPLDRRLASRVFNLLTRLFFGLRLTDTQCGAKLMTRAALGAILPKLGITQWAFDVDLLLQLRRGGYRIREIPTVWCDVEGSKLQVRRASPEMLLALTRLRLIYSPFRWVVGFYDRFLGPWIHPQGMDGDRMLTHSLIMMVGGQVGNLCNLLFQMAMVRMLAPGDYGVMAAMLGVLLTLSFPLTSLASTVTHFAAQYSDAGQRERVAAMVRGFARDLGLPAVLLLGAVALWHPQLGRFFHLDSGLPLWLTAASIVVMAYGALPSGVLTGIQAFEWVVIFGNGWTVVRLAAGILLVLAGFGVAGALTAHFAAIAMIAACSVWICRKLLGPGGHPAERPDGAYVYMGRYAAAFAAYGVLSNADVILAKHYFPAGDAGLFAQVAMPARTIFFLSGPIAAAMFPKFALTGRSSRTSVRTLIKAAWVTGILVAAAAGACVAAPALVLRLVAGVTANPDQLVWLRGMALALLPLTFVFLLVNYELAQRRFWISAPLALCAAGYLAAAARWHGDLLQVIVCLGAASSVALILSLACLPWRQMREATAEGGRPDGTGEAGRADGGRQGSKGRTT